MVDDFSPSRFASEMQLRTRKEKNFDKVEADLPQYEPHLPIKRFSGFDAVKAQLLRWNPFSKPVTRDDTVWLLDNTAFRTSRFASWQAEFVAAVFETDDDSKVVDLVSGVAKVLGLADDAKEKETIQKRLMPFVWDIRVGRTVDIVQHGSKKPLRLGPTGTNGVLSQVVKIGSHGKGSLVLAKAEAEEGPSTMLNMQTYYAGPDGWAIISDIDDTIKVTTTSDPIGILRETFINDPKPVDGMPELYKDIKAALPKDSPWFYLSASPYNLYPFLREFRNSFYPPGTMILRDSSWRSIAGLLAALTMNTEEYKVDRMKKINTWLPSRKMIVIGDSTQSDPEAYGEIYRTLPGWIHLILIRKVTDSAMLGLSEKNDPERFEKAFKDIPKEAWHVFEEPSECLAIVKQTVKK